MSDDIIERAEYALMQNPSTQVAKGIIADLLAELKAERAENERLRATSHSMRHQ